MARYQDAGPKRLFRKSPETNRAWAGSLSTGEYEHGVTGGTANEHDDTELSGFSNFAEGNQANAGGFRGTLFRATRALS
jgi:hypothetical protein